MRRFVLPLAFLLVACSDGGSSSTTSSATAVDDPTTVATDDLANLPATDCVTTPPPEHRLVHITLDDMQAGFGSLGSRANDGLTPGVIRVELEADAENAGPVGVLIQKDGQTVATIGGVEPGDTCGIDLDVTEGQYVVFDGTNDVAIVIEAAVPTS